MSGASVTKDPLQNFNKLNDGQHWYTPPESEHVSSTAPTTQPDLILFCAWAFAAPRYIAKYTDQYRRVYPGAQILLLQSSLGNLAWTSDRVQMQRLQPAVGAIKDFLTTGYAREAGGRGRTRDPLVLLHAFSNGGSHSAVQLAQAYRESMKSKQPDSSRSQLPSELPICAMILDSCPGKPDFHVGAKVALTPIPQNARYMRLFFMPLAYVLITFIKAVHELGFSENVVSKLWNSLNDAKGPFLIKTGNSIGEGGGAEGIVPRTYIYSNRDEMVPWQNVLEHAGDARQAAARAVRDSESGKAEDAIRLEGFFGSAHVNHVSVDPGRYWRVVEETMERAVVF